MSFCEEQKNEIITSQYKSLCCRRSLVSGVLFAKGVLSDGVTELRITESYARSFVASLIKEIYSKEPEVISPKGGGRGKVVAFKSNSAARYIGEILKDGTLFVPKCSFCRSAFLRGVFLVSGRVSDPGRQYSLEFQVGSSSERLRSFLEDIGVPLKTAVRASGTVIYTKNSTVIEDFFGLAAMNVTTFSVMNSKIKSELRNNANRVANCETNNINKAVETAMRQVALISSLEEAGLLGALPEELAHTARLRLEYKSLSLSQLAAKFTPSISKPGLSHRLNKIEELGKKLLGNK